MSTSRMLVFTALALLFVGCSYAVFKVVSRRRLVERYERGYSQIKVGDSKDFVLTLMGNPSRITNCVQPWFSDKELEIKYQANCKELYRYEEVFPTDYTVSFDKEGRVIDKTTAVSP